MNRTRGSFKNRLNAELFELKIKGRILFELRVHTFKEKKSKGAGAKFTQGKVSFFSCNACGGVLANFYMSSAVLNSNLAFRASCLFQREPPTRFLYREGHRMF